MNMRKNFYFWLAAILFVWHCPMKGDTLTGLVVDSENNEPLFGVTVMCRGVAVAFSDDEGRFTLTTDTLQPQDTVFFRHISYHEQAVVLSLLRTDSVVRMESRFFSLSEVTVTPVNYQKLIKAIVTKYKKSTPAQPYWTKIHQSQSLTHRGESAGYVEYTGYMLCMGSDINSPFIENKWIPEHIRRAKENPTVSLIFGDQYRVRISENSIKSLWVEYRFFDVTHPLGKYHKNYEVRVDSSFTVDGKAYWALSYRQKTRIVVAGWTLSNNSGQMWVEKNTNRLTRLTGNCNQGNNFVTQASIEYGTFDNKVVPREMQVSVIKNINLRGSRAQDKILYESRILFSEADNRKMKKYMNDYVEVFEEMIVTKLPYEPEYWTTFPPKDNMNFAEGAQLPIFRYPDDPDIQNLRISSQTGMQKMKNEISTLSWKTIQPIQ